MLRPTGANSPYIIITVNCVWVAIAAFIALKAKFRCAALLPLSPSSPALILLA